MSKRVLKRPVFLTSSVRAQRISSSLKSVAMLWSEFVSEIRWFWEQVFGVNGQGVEV
jgi:hypothetical protein